jgi:catechol 2,3-dioxygenase-like lactoylglutathione lyase family enzyme
MEIVGIVFAGTATDRSDEMSSFLEETLGLRRVATGGTDAAVFELADGSHFAVHGLREDGDSSRTIGFHVRDLDAAIAELRAAGIEVDDAQENERFRYAHFTAPDGKLYELVAVRSS